MRYYELFENSNSFIYHWTTVPKALTAIKTNKLQARKWKHYLETENRLAQGTSWSKLPSKWDIIEYNVCFVANTSKIPNKIHSINGSRTFHLTRGMLDPNHDPTAYKYEPTEPDEEFIEGTINNLSSILTEIRLRGLSESDIQNVQSLNTKQIKLVQI